VVWTDPSIYQTGIANFLVEISTEINKFRTLKCLDSDDSLEKKSIRPTNSATNTCVANGRQLSEVLRL
jgi:hypothetical protein